MDKVRSSFNNLAAAGKHQLEARKHMVTYAAIGILGLWVDLGGFYLLFNVFEVDKSLANFVSSVTAIFHNFILNYFFNFKNGNHFLRRLASFYAVGAVGIFLTQCMFWVFSDGVGITPNIVKPAAIVVVFVVQFNLNKVISFRK